VAEPDDVQRDLLQLEAEIRRLEAEYNMFFAGQLPTPPWETRARVDAIVRRYDRGYIQAYVDRFRFSTLRARYATFADLWDRGLRAREEGRPGPFSRPGAGAGTPPRAGDRILHVTTLTDPARDQDKVHELYTRLADARRELGEDAVPFHKFVHLLREQVARLRQKGTPEVAFRVAIKGGKVRLTARALKGIAAAGGATDETGKR
jgi:hypothetical protein